MADVQRPGGIGGNELDHDAPAGAAGAAPEGRALAPDLAYHRESRRGGKRQVDEARPRDLRASDLGVAAERGDDGLGGLARLAAHALGELQRDVGREVAVLRILRSIELDLDLASLRKCRAHRLANEVGEA